MIMIKNWVDAVICMERGRFTQKISLGTKEAAVRRSPSHKRLASYEDRRLAASPRMRA